MGLFSYVIAWAQTEEKKTESTAIPCWFQILADAGYDQAFLNGLRFLTVCSFLPKTQCAGAFVHLTPENKAQQPSIHWFCYFNIPVWYRWGEHEVQSVKVNPKLAQFAPLAHQLQAATMIIVQEPLLRNTCNSRRDGTKCKAIPWQEYFTARDSLNVRNLASETTADAAKRLQHQRNPPTTSAKVYQWLPGLEDASSLVRELVTKSRRWEVLLSYPVAQKQYDSWRNEWDCCKAFQPQARIDEDMEDVILYTRHGASEINPYDNDLLPPTVSFPFSPEDAPTPKPCDQTTSSAADIEGNLDGNDFDLYLLQSTYETVEVLSCHHSFVTPPLFPSCSSLTEVEATEDQTKFLHLLGKA